MQQHLADDGPRERSLQLLGLGTVRASARKQEARQNGWRLHDRPERHDIGLERLALEVQQRDGRGEGDNADRPVVRRDSRGVGGIDPGRPPKERVGQHWKQRAERHGRKDSRENRAAKAAVGQLSASAKPDRHHQIEGDALAQGLRNREAGLQHPCDDAQKEEQDDRRHQALQRGARYVHARSPGPAATSRSISAAMPSAISVPSCPSSPSSSRMRTCPILRPTAGRFLP